MAKKCPFCGEPCAPCSSMCDKHRAEWSRVCGDSLDTGVTIRWAANKARRYERAKWQRAMNDLREKFIPKWFL